MARAPRRANGLRDEAASWARRLGGGKLPRGPAAALAPSGARSGRPAASSRAVSRGIEGVSPTSLSRDPLAQCCGLSRVSCCPTRCPAGAHAIGDPVARGIPAGPLRRRHRLRAHRRLPSRHPSGQAAQPGTVHDIRASAGRGQIIAKLGVAEEGRGRERELRQALRASWPRGGLRSPRPARRARLAWEQTLPMVGGTRQRPPPLPRRQRSCHPLDSHPGIWTASSPCTRRSWMPPRSDPSTRARPSRATWRCTTTRGSTPDTISRCGDCRLRRQRSMGSRSW